MFKYNRLLQTWSFTRRSCKRISAPYPFSSSWCHLLLLWTSGRNWQRDRWRKRGTT